ncbi:MAG TPA: glycine betaine ABC transporter substrate-binding protein [Sedimentisphaerales bacterium]|nr:glycine betaine ABC transporter substrate-binding protein [Sedimentisphaerales bacterium]
MGIIAQRIKRLRHWLVAFVNLFQTIPSLAMLAILLVVMGKIGVAPALLALVLYALLPIVRNTITGLNQVSPDINEAGRGIGMTAGQLLWRVQFPLAFPVIMAGVRTATVVGVGIATLSAFIGAGGLGQFINRGLATYNTNLILLGAIPAAILALAADGCLSLAEHSLRPTPFNERHKLRYRLKPIFVTLPVILFASGMLLVVVPRVIDDDPAANSEAVIKIGTKNFTEQLILGELMAQLIEDHTDLRVERRFNLGGTMICHNSLIRGEIDLYAEYTGTALTAILNKSATNDPDVAYDRVTDAYHNQYDLIWLKPFGFDNTYTITVRQAAANEYNWNTIDDLVPDAPQLHAGFTSEFMEREDGYPGLKEVYRIDFGKVSDLEPSLMYDALAKGQVDVICGFATDGRIVRYDLKPLEDNMEFFPPYEAAPVIRRELLNAYPELRSILERLDGRLDNATMQQLNSRVDQGQMDIQTVVRDFLIEMSMVSEDQNEEYR